MQFQSKEHIHRALSLLGQLLDAARGNPISLLVCGGASLILLGQVTRTTEDIDVLTYFENEPVDQFHLKRHTDFPQEIKRLMGRVAADMDINEKWLNLGPSSLVQIGLPDGLLTRIHSKRYGKSLTALYLDRLDQIHLKLYASLSGDERHIQDLIILKPTDKELLQAKKWIETVMLDAVLPSDLEDMIRKMGYGHII
ncbi:hypothetical protein JW926_04330 [Candidatus Sumerlaeota bacterium]|nr:hypothetical protein [Candidatus Sumerlaeota bacterium]